MEIQFILIAQLVVVVFFVYRKKEQFTLKYSTMQLLSIIKQVVVFVFISCLIKNKL